MISLVAYQDKYLPDFKRLNLEWLEKYDLTEQYDLDILNDPQASIIDKGGCIFIALDVDTVVGTAGLSKAADSEYELVKMAVDPAYRGKGIGKMLLNHCIEAAKKLGIHAIVAGIEAGNEASIALHEKFGFVEVAHFKEVGLKFNKWMDLKFLELIV